MFRLGYFTVVFTIFMSTVSGNTTRSWYYNLTTTTQAMPAVKNTFSRTNPVSVAPTPGHHLYTGKTGTIQEWNSYYTYHPTTELYRIDNPENKPVVIHFRHFSYADSHNCTRESVAFYPRDWPFDVNIQRFCGHSLPGNGYLYIPNLGMIESKKESYSSSSFSFDYELVDVVMTTPSYYYTTVQMQQLPKSRLLDLLRNMEQQLQALEGEAKFAYDLLDGSHVNNYAKRSVVVQGVPNDEDGAPVDNTIAQADED